MIASFVRAHPLNDEPVTFTDYTNSALALAAQQGASRHVMSRHVTSRHVASRGDVLCADIIHVKLCRFVSRE